MPLKKEVTVVDFSEFEGEGAAVTYWINPPTGLVRAFQRATTKLNLPSPKTLRKTPANLDELREVLNAADNAFEIEDAMWSFTLPLIVSWTLRGFEDEVLPVSTEGLDGLPAEERQAVLSRLIDALQGVRKLDPTQGASSSNTEADLTAPETEPTSIVELAHRMGEQSLSLESSLETG